MSNKPLPLADTTLAFLGDSITDGGTLALVFEQSLQGSGITPPRCLNAGVCGNRACDMLARLDRDVLPYKPDYMTLSAGVNDANSGITAKEFERDVTTILDRMQAAGTQVILLTPTPNTSANTVNAKPLLDAYLVTLHRLADERGLRIAEINRDMQANLDAGGIPIAEDGIHITFEGYRVMVRSLLDALNYGKVPTVTNTELAPLPGLITPWKLRACNVGTSLDATTVATLQPDTTWKTLSLPQTEPCGSWWSDQERQRGFAIDVNQLLGQAKRYQGYSEITVTMPRQVYLNTGGSLETIWLNGHKIFQTPGYSGWHPGKERILVTLVPGTNRLIIETGASFFLSITKDKDW